MEEIKPENIPLSNQPQPPKQLNKKMIIVVAVSSIVLAFAYIISPKSITSCGVLPTGPSCAKYVCWGIPIQGVGRPICWGKLKLVGPTSSSQLDQNQSISKSLKTYKDENNGFEFQYPEDWTIKNESGGISLVKYGPRQSNTIDSVEFFDGATLFISVEKSNYIKITEGDQKFSEAGFNGFFSNDAGDGLVNNEYIEANRLLDNGKFLTLEWSRSDFYKINDLSYKKYLLPILSTFKFTPLVTVQQTNINNIAVPALFGNNYLKWQKIIFDPHNPSFEFALRYDNFNYQSNPAQRLQKIMPLSGYLWVAKVDDSGGANLDQIRDNFTKYYENILKQSDWDFTQDIPSQQISINGPTADGALGSVWGYVKIQDKSVRLIGLSYDQSVSKWIDVSDSAPTPVCPCGTEFKVFVSDEIDINKLTLH